MSNYTRQSKRKKLENKAPRCCGQHMFMNKYGLWQCRKCGRQKFDIGKADSGVAVDGNLEVTSINPEQSNATEE